MASSVQERKSGGPSRNPINIGSVRFEGSPRVPRFLSARRRITALCRRAMSTLRSSLKPDFPPIRIDAARTKAATLGIPGLTSHAVQNDCVVFQLDHSAGLFVDDLFHPFEDTKCAVAEWHRFPVEVHAPVFRFLVQGLEYVLVVLHTNRFTWSQIQFRRGRSHSRAHFAPPPGIGRAASKFLKTVVRPPHCGTETQTCGGEIVIDEKQERRDHLGEPHVAGSEVFCVLAKIPPTQWLRRVSQVG